MEVTLRALANILPYRRARSFLGRPGLESKCPVCGGAFIAWQTVTSAVGVCCENCVPEAVIGHLSVMLEKHALLKLEKACFISGGQ